MRRRNALKLGALALGPAAIAAPAALAESPGTHPAGPATGAAAAPSGTVPPPVTVPPFTRPLVRPPVLRPVLSTRAGDHYAMVLRESRHEIAPGLHTVLRTFGGSFPGPTIEARRGRPVSLHLTNALDVPTVTHLHGGHNARVDDGHPLDLVAPGASRTYHYPNDQRAAPLWYHDHAYGHDAENVYRGLAGFYRLTDAYEDSLPLPSGRFDIPLLLRDAHLAADGSLVYDPSSHDGSDRTAILVNGRTTPYLRVAARKYRLRLVNAANERAFELRFADGAPLVQIASDGGLLAAPLETDTVSVWPGERAEVVVDFSRYAPGDSVVLENTVAFPGEHPEVLRFDVVRRTADGSRVPSRFLPIGPPPPARTERTFAMSFDPKSGMYLINGKAYDPKRTDFSSAEGVAESWTVTNTDTKIPIPHNFHVHLAQFRITERAGKPPAAAEAGWKDTVTVHPGETVRFTVRFEDHRGQFVYHCHMLEHMMMGMMGQFDVVRGARA